MAADLKGPLLGLLGVGLLLYGVFNLDRCSVERRHESANQLMPQLQQSDVVAVAVYNNLTYRPPAGFRVVGGSMREHGGGMFVILQKE